MNLNFEEGIKTLGNNFRLKKLFERAENGEDLTLVFLGGSITQGAVSTTPETCYAYLTYMWFVNTFPKANFKFVNAGIGGTDSQFGVARADKDVLRHKPDFVVVEFSVNDGYDAKFKETYEGLVRKLWTSETKPALVAIHNVRYDCGENAELMHSRVVRHYDLPSVSMQSLLYKKFLTGELTNREFTPDDLHPNDKGHKILSDLVVCLLEKIKESPMAEKEIDFPAPLTANAYEKSVRLQNYNSRPGLFGFVADEDEQTYIGDCFKNGWEATDEGDSIIFNVKCSEIAVQYRKTMRLPAPIAKVIIDDDEENAKILDANFDETWGDKLVIDSVMTHGVYGEHKVEIRLVETHEDDKKPFYLVSVITSEGGIYNKEPLFLNPTCSHNIWGGTRIKYEFGFYNLEGEDIGECWGISAHPNGDGTVREGSFAGMKLSKVWDKHPYLFGNAALQSDRFPLLTKIIDAKDDLSIQVHPEDEYAKVNENGSFGKTECWYIMDCPEGSTLVIGHNAKSKEELSDMIKNGKWNDFIREIPVKKGDFIQIDPGTVHAIKGGVLILETQQNSDITYRVYDYDRLQNGKPRELHVEKSIDVITVPAKEAKDSVKSFADTPVNEMTEMYSCDYYKVFKIEVDGEMEFDQSFAFLNMSVLEGCGLLNEYGLKKGEHLILPCGFGKVKLSGKMTIIASTI